MTTYDLPVCFDQALRGHSDPLCGPISLTQLMGLEHSVTRDEIGKGLVHVDSSTRSYWAVMSRSPRSV
jgi:hypothetical protein